MAIAVEDETATDHEKDELQLVLLGKRTPRAMSVVRYKDAARMLDLSVLTVKRLVKAGRLKAAAGSGSRSCGVTRTSLDEYVG